jgi:hypothetical protein
MVGFCEQVLRTSGFRKNNKFLEQLNVVGSGARLRCL